MRAGAREIGSGFNPLTPSRAPDLPAFVALTLSRSRALPVVCIAIGLLAFMNNGASIFWSEIVAVVAFAVAWLVKGRIVLKV